MIKKIVILCMTTIMLTACTGKTENADEGKYKALYEELSEAQPPTYERITLEDATGKVVVENESGWYELGSGSKVIAKTEGTATDAELYFVPSGSETTNYQQLIASGPVTDNSVSFSLTPEQFTDGLGYLWLVTYNKELGRKSHELKVSILEE